MLKLSNKFSTFGMWFCVEEGYVAANVLFFFFFAIVCLDVILCGSSLIVFESSTISLVHVHISFIHVGGVGIMMGSVGKCWMLGWFANMV